MSEQTEKLKLAIESLAELETFNNDADIKVEEISLTIKEVIYDLEKQEYHKNVADWMTNQGFANHTEAAEEAAKAFRHEEWLDQPEHWIWDLALNAVLFNQLTED